jgi:hypothetical protein
MDIPLPTPPHAPSTPQSGWWKSPASLATDPVFLRVSDEHRLAAVGLYTAALGWTLTHNSEEGWVPAAALFHGQVCAAPADQLRTVANELVDAGIFSAGVLGDMDGFVVAGADKAIRERFARQLSASAAGKASAEAQASARPTAQKYPTKIDANKPVDWSKETGEL